MVDYRREIGKALARQRAAADDNRTALDRIAGRAPAGVLTLDDIVEVVARALKAERRELLAHMNRLVTLSKMSDRDEDIRGENLHRRLVHLESVVRRMQKGER